MPRDEQDLPIIPHEVVGGKDCCGCLVVKVHGDQADIRCNECGEVIRTVAASEAARVLEGFLIEMASEATCSARCSHCGALNTFPLFSSIEAFICSECGVGISVEGDTSQ